MPEQHGGIAPHRSQLGHVVEVHPVDAGDHRGDGGDGHPRGDLAHVLVLADGDLRLVGLQHGGEQVVEVAGPLDGPHQRVADVPEERCDVGRHPPVTAVGQPEERRGQGLDGGQQVEHLADELVDLARGLLAGVAEHVPFQLALALLQRVEDGLVVVDDAVGDGVQHRARTELEEIGPALGLLPDAGERARLAVADRHHEVLTEEHGDLAEAQLAAGPVVAGGAQHHEERVVVDLELGPDVVAQGVLHGELVEVEHLLRRRDLVRGRHVQAEPHEGLLRKVVALVPAPGVVERQQPGHALPVQIGSTVDDHTHSVTQPLW